MRKLLGYVVATFLSIPLFSSYVSCQIDGQLGNQLFEVATALAHAWDCDMTPVFPALNNQHPYTMYNRDHLFFRLDTSLPAEGFQNLYTQQHPFSLEKIPCSPNLFLKGYFQCWEYFDHYRDRLLTLFSPSDARLENLKVRYGELLSHPKTVAIHVRLCAKWKHDFRFPFVGLDYYKDAIRLFDEDSLFVVFSDRISWCKRQFSSLCKNVVYIEGNDHIDDLYLMSMMKDIIMGASTFSWWGAYLNQNPDKKVVAPNQWIHPNHIRCVDYLKEFYLPDWTILPIVFGKYPDDVTEDDVSQSIDD